MASSFERPKIAWEEVMKQWRYRLTLSIDRSKGLLGLCSMTSNSWSSVSKKKVVSKKLSRCLYKKESLTRAAGVLGAGVTAKP